MSILPSPLSSSCRAPAFEDAPVFTPNVDFGPHPRLSKDIRRNRAVFALRVGTKLPLELRRRFIRDSFGLWKD